MKLQLLSLLTVFGLSSTVFAQNFELLSSSEELITLKHELVEKPLETIVIDGINYTDFSLSHAILSSDLGSPAMPFFTESVILPNQGKVSLTYAHEGYIEYNDVRIAPSKGNLKRNVNPSEVAFTFGEVYEMNDFFPGQLVTLSDAFNLRTTRGVTAKINPYQYNPVTQTLRVYQNIEVRVTIDETQIGLNELATTADSPAIFNAIYSSLYLNANAVIGRYTPKEEEGDMLIIAGDSYLDVMAPFVEWKIQKGIKTSIVGTSVAGDTDTEIKAYISDAYAANPDLLYILLVGDHSTVPSHTYGMSGWEELWSDSYYGQLTGGSSDFYPELFVGRFSGGTTQIETMVERTLEYEKTPLAGDWMTNAIGLASDEGSGYGDDGEADWQHARNNRAKLLSFGYNEVYEFYDGTHGGEDAPGNPTSAIINPAVNDGIGLFNYTGHGDIGTCITGNYSSSHINAATNKGKYPFVISVACNNGSFTSGTCISEVWLNATSGGTPTGAIAACGSTILMAWAEPMEVQDEMAKIIAEEYVANKKETLGGIFYNSQMSMLEDYSSSTTAKEVMQTWVFFGDPSTQFRNKVTENIEVIHYYNLPLGATSLDIACEVEGALGAVVQNGELIGRETVVGGSATITFDPLVSDQPLLLTVTRQNHKPYQVAIRVGDGPAGITDQNEANISTFPNPAESMLNIVWTNTPTPTLIEMKDVSGKTVRYENILSGNAHIIDVQDLAPGLYIVNTTSNGQITSKKVVIK